MPTLSVKPALISKKTILVMSWPYKANWDLLNSLNNGCYLTGQDEHPLGVQTVLLFSLYKLLEYKLGATALDASRGKFTSAKIDTQKGHAILTLTTEPTFSAVRKVLTIVSKNFTPAKLMPLYKKYAQLLGIKVDAGHFVYAVDQMVSGAKTLQTFITGTIKVPDGKLANLKELNDAIKPIKADGKSATPASDASKPLVTWDEIDCASRLDAFLVQQLLQTMQIESHVRDGNLIPITGSSKWDTVKNKFDNERIKRFIELKLVKLGAKLPDVMRLMCAASGYFTAGDLDKLPVAYTPATLTAMLKKHF